MARVDRVGRRTGRRDGRRSPSSPARGARAARASPSRSRHRQRPGPPRSGRPSRRARRRRSPRRCSFAARSSSGRSAHWPVNIVTGRAISASSWSRTLRMLAQPPSRAARGRRASVHRRRPRRTGAPPARRSTSTGMASAGRPVGSHGRPARQRMSVLAFSPTKARLLSPSTTAVPDPRPSSRSSAAASAGGSPTMPTSESPSSSPARERPGRPRLAEAAVCDQLHDVPPGRGSSRRALPRTSKSKTASPVSALGQQLDPLRRPLEGRVEAVAGDEQRDVVEGLPGAARSSSDALPHLDLDAARRRRGRRPSPSRRP